MEKISFITFVYGADRLKNLELTMFAATTNAPANTEFILYEQHGQHAKSLAQKYNFKYYCQLEDIQSPAYWRNRAIEKATNELVVINDSDIIPYPGFFKQIQLTSKRYRYFGNYTNVINLNEELTNQILQDPIETNFGYNITADELKELKHRHYINTGSNGGSNTIRRSDFDAIGGYDESYIGMGKEDNDFIIRLTRYIIKIYGRNSISLLTNTILHSNHDRKIQINKDNDIKYMNLLRS